MGNKGRTSKKRIYRHFRSYLYALRGITRLFKTEFNFWVHISIAICTIMLGFIFDLSSLEWVAVVLCCGLVLSAEAINTAIEYLANYCTTEKNEQIRKVKDVAAGAVLFCAITAFVVGLIIFIPKLFY
ncbi:MAG: diacylglycerol kinase family protein [Prevotellaceae bacterium]|nr:diacylglycerol kinase family protein [Prevotellaceae bacterium]